MPNDSDNCWNMCWGGETSIEEAMALLRSLPYEDLGFAKLDHHRALRNGFPEVVYCPGKTTEHILAILDRLILRAPKVLASRASPEVAQAVLNQFPDNAVYHELARMLVVTAKDEEREEGKGKREKESSSSTLNSQLSTLNSGYDSRRVGGNGGFAGCGRGGDHGFGDGEYGRKAVRCGRSGNTPPAEQSGTAVCGECADRGGGGMEGALASVVGGLVSRPVIAVPTSIGYGASFQGLSALLTMLNSCATGVGVVNIDNGFGAGYLAHLINQSVERAS